MKVAVTGGSGFIGSRIVKELTKAGHDVYSVDIVSPAKREESSGRFSFVQADLTSFESAKRALEGMDCVYHIAGVVLEDIRKNPFKGSELNIDMTRNVVQSAKDNNTPKVIFASSFYVFDGISERMVVNEETPLNTLDMELFGSTKVFGESLLKEYARRYGMKYVILRFGSAYGSGRCSNVIKTFIESGLNGRSVDVWGPGKRRNQYTYVDDLAAGSLLAIEKENQIYNLISPEETTIKQLVEIISSKVDITVTFDLQKKEGASMPYMSSRKAISELHWMPVPIERGVEIVIDEIKNARPLPHINNA